MKQIPVILFGAGGVGQALIRQMVNGRSLHLARHQLRFELVAIADSQSCLWAAEGLSDTQLLTAVAAKQQHQPLCQEARPTNLDILETAVAAGLEQVIVVDVTATNGMEPVLNRALQLGYGVVLANKKPLAGPWETAVPFFHHPRLRHESTVGGGQPVIATLRYLLDVNDPIRQITGQLSGSIGFICQQLDLGVPFSQAIAQAKANGYTEPDPRDDLGGLDVMRKILILGRMAGWPMETADITVESLYPAEMAGLSLADFMAATPQLDAAMTRRVQTAAATGQVLRYVAQVADGRGSVSLTALPRTSPLANLKYVSFRTPIYHDEPLLIGGKGAGVEMTAAGVVGDMVGLGSRVVF